MADLCSICSLVIREWDLEKYPGLLSGMPSFQFGRLDEIRTRTECPLCQLLLSLVPFPSEHLDHIPTLAGQVYNLSHAVGKNDPCDLNIFLDGTVGKGQSMMKGQRIGSLTTKQLWKDDVEEFPISVVRWEISDCLDSHSNDELDELYKKRAGRVGIRLIDVVSRNVCERTIDERYLALSYVWGGVAGLQATKGNREELQAVGSLRDDNPRLPRVIKDAMEVTRMIGERFLWVDSLCIEQDNAVHKSEQIGLMDRIYLCSVLTVVALSGQSGQASLPGVQAGTALNPKASAIINGRKVFVRPPSLFETFENSRYETRGWTFQERCLSPRLLIFTPHAWYYHCHGAMLSNGMWWQQKGNAGHHSLFESFNILRCLGQDLTTSHAPTPGISEFFRYEAVVLIYTARQLSYSSDALNAVSALLDGISVKMQSAFLLGLPERFFGLSLLWIPTGSYPENSGPRRVRNLDSGGKALFPSWTWLGWIGQSHYAPGLRLPCFPSQDDVLHWLDGQNSVGFIDDVDSYVLAMDSNPTKNRQLNMTKRPTANYLFGIASDSLAVEKVSWTHLIFSAWTADAMQFSLQAATVDKPWCGGAFQNVRFDNWHPTRIMDGKAQHCGCLYEFVQEGFDLGIDITRCKFIALSSSNAACLAPGRCCDPAKPPETKPLVEQDAVIVGDDDSSDDSQWENVETRHDCRVKDFMFDAKLFGRAEWCFVNVMLVSWVAGHAERVGVGLIHREAWLAAKRKEETVHLYQVIELRHQLCIA